MATLKLGLFARPDEEIERTRVGDVPQWIERIYSSYGVSRRDAPLSLSVEAVAEGLHHRLARMALLLKKMEQGGWKLELENWNVVARTNLTTEEAQEQLERLGVWIIAHEAAPVDEEGNVRWTRPWFLGGEG
ncbi:MAG: hypothetical protein QOE92_918 [Chloroflexota bacterium]|nr:hypothetical protein [Chloroflexota bacterium]